MKNLPFNLLNATFEQSRLLQKFHNLYQNSVLSNYLKTSKGQNLPSRTRSGY